ncbi:MAG TPA: Sec-independent protein translocase protein TatB [Rhizobiaceae bacterium]|nr:Sec-independent protein translocase protein TatB [Rhizobiaceae bacterium]
MFEVGWTEMLVIAIVMIVVVGPKDLPKMLRAFGKTTSKLRVMAGDFRKQFDEALKEAELDDVKGVIDEARKLNPTNQVKDALNPMRKAADDVRAGLQSALNPGTAPKVPPSTPVPAEPLKNGSVELPAELLGDGSASDMSKVNAAAAANMKASAPRAPAETAAATPAPAEAPAPTSQPKTPRKAAAPRKAAQPAEAKAATKAAATKAIKPAAAAKPARKTGAKPGGASK